MKEGKDHRYLLQWFQRAGHGDVTGGIAHTRTPRAPRGLFSLSRAIERIGGQGYICGFCRYDDGTSETNVNLSPQNDTTASHKPNRNNPPLSIRAKALTVTTQGIAISGAYVHTTSWYRFM